MKTGQNEAVIGRHLVIAAALAAAFGSACGDDAPRSIAAEVAIADEEPDTSTSEPVDADASPASGRDDSETDAGTETDVVAASADAASAEAAWPDVPDFAWPPVTLAPGEPPVMPATVAVIGDSIALSAQEIVTAAIEFLDVEILAYDAVESRRMISGSEGLPSGASAIADLVEDATYPELWIVALGTNDVGAMSGADSVRADIERLLSLIPDEAHLIWVDTWAEPFDEGAVAFNSLLRDTLAARDYTTVLDWYTIAEVDGLIIADGVHLSEVGKVEFARMIGDGLRAAFDRG